MDTAFILVVVGLSSLAAGVVARGRSRRRLRSAVGKALETIGLATVFLFLNVGVGFALTLVARVVGGRFVSLYHSDDVTILAVAVLQALVWQWSREPEASAGP
jgi:hypothetical protein